MCEKQYFQCLIILQEFSQYLELSVHLNYPAKFIWGFNFGKKHCVFIKLGPNRDVLWMSFWEKMISLSQTAQLSSGSRTPAQPLVTFLSVYLFVSQPTGEVFNLLSLELSSVRGGLQHKPKSERERNMHTCVLLFIYLYFYFIFDEVGSRHIEQKRSPESRSLSPGHACLPIPVPCSVIQGH